MTHALYPYQRDGAAWLAQRGRGYLADEMRLGKTPQAVEAWNHQLADAAVTIVCPAYLRINWQREIDRWAWMPIQAQVISYEGVVRNGLPKASAYVFDEAHYLMSPGAKRTQACLGIDEEGALAASHVLRSAEFIWPLSGTPGNPAQMWTWLRVFGATKMSYAAWVERYCRTRVTVYGLQVLGVKTAMLAELKAIMSPWFLRRTAAQVGLPQARWGVLSLACGVDNGDNHGHRIDPNGLDLPEKDEHIATLMRELGERKVPAILEALKAELDSGELNKIVVFAWHRNVLRALEDGLKAYGAMRVDGTTSELTKQLHVDRFREEPQYRVLIGQIEAAGVGWDLSVASDVLFAELSWNPDDNSQAAARVLGPKQTRPVLVRVAASEDPLDYAVARVTARKNSTIQKTWS